MLAHLQPVGHGVEGGAQPVELRSVGGKPGARREVAAGDLGDRLQQPLGRAAHEIDGGQRHQRRRQQRRGHDQGDAALVGAVEVAERLRRAQSDQDAKPVRPGAGGGEGDHPRRVVAPIARDDAGLVFLQQLAGAGAGGLADEAGAIGACARTVPSRSTTDAVAPGGSSIWSSSWASQSRLSASTITPSIRSAAFR